MHIHIYIHIYIHTNTSNLYQASIYAINEHELLLAQKMVVFGGLVYLVSSGNGSSLVQEEADGSACCKTNREV